MYGMRTRSTDRVELRAPPGRADKWRRAAQLAGVSLSDWARRRLDDLADAELATQDDDRPPTAEDIRVALEARGAMGKVRAERLRARIHAARRTPWRGRS